MNGSERQATHVLEARARLGEGPIWDDRSATLLWVDIFNYRVHRYDPAVGSNETYDVGDAVGAVALTERSTLLVALRDRIAELDPESGKLDTRTRFEHFGKGKRLNDGKVDPGGRFWVGSMTEEEGEARLYRFDPDGSLHVMDTGFTISNGLDWSPDLSTFYLTDSPAGRIYAYDYDVESGAISDRRVFVEVDGEPDGLTVDMDGFVWSARWDEGCVVRFGPDGKEDMRVTVPVPLSTSCHFGGEDLRDLYITTGSVGLSQEEIDEAVTSGDLYRYQAPVAGRAAFRFRNG